MKMTSNVEFFEQGNSLDHTSLNSSLHSLELPEQTQTEIQNAEVLYQKLGGRWYAFSVIGDEVFVGKVSPKK